MDLEVMVVCLEVIDGLLPVGSENFPRGTGQALIDLLTCQ